MCIVTDRESGRRWRASRRDAFLLQSIASGIPVCETRRLFEVNFATDLPERDYWGAIASFRAAGILVPNDAPCADEQFIESESVRGVVPQSQRAMLCFWNADRLGTSSSLRPIISWLLSDAAFAAWWLIIVVTELIILTIMHDAIHTSVSAPRQAIFICIAIMSIIFAVTIICHELGHGIAAVNMGGRVGRIGIGVTNGFPYALTEINWTLISSIRDKVKTILVGPAISLSILPFATLLWFASSKDTLPRILAADMMVWYNAACLAQLIPIVKTDGYLALTGLLRMPELMKDSYRYVLRPFGFARYGFRIEAECPKYTSVAYVGYGLTSIVSLIMLASWFIGRLLSYVLK